MVSALQRADAVVLGLQRTRRPGAFKAFGSLLMPFKWRNWLEMDDSRGARLGLDEHVQLRVFAEADDFFRLVAQERFVDC